jgi:hypothetical protein
MHRARHIVMCVYLALALSISPIPGIAREALDAGAACLLLQKTIAKRDGLPESGPPATGWFCDIAPSGDSSLFVIALRSSKPVPSGRLFGWFAVSRASGAVQGWDVKKQRTMPLQASDQVSPPRRYQ